MTHLVSWDTLIGLCLWAFIGWCASSFIICYYAAATTDHTRPRDDRRHNEAHFHTTLLASIGFAVIWLLTRH